MKPTSLLSLSAALCLFSAPALAQTQVDVPASRDNTLYEDARGGISNGAGGGMFAGMPFNGLVYRAVIHFDVAAAIPAGSNIVSAELVLEMDRTISGPVNVDLHALTADWGEGASVGGGIGGGAGGLSTDCDATWVHRFYGGSSCSSTNWNNPGGDFVAAASASASINGNGIYSWSSTQLTADVQSWLGTPATNFGWILRGDETTAGLAKRFVTKEATIGQAPILRITYGQAASTTVIGSGCGSGPLAFDSTSPPTLGTSSFDLAISGGAGPLPYVLFLSPALSPVPLPLSPSCTLDLNPLALFSFGSGAMNAQGDGSLSLPIPGDPLLMAAPIFLQVIALEPGFERGLVVSNALAVQIGV